MNGRTNAAAVKGLSPKRWMTVLLGASLAVGGGLGCSSSPPSGTLYVTVTNESMIKIADAVVTTTPKSKSAVTDALGSVIMTIPEGAYAVTAVHPTAGAGRKVVMVTAKQITQVVVALDPNPSISPGAPTAQIIAPLSGAVAKQGTALSFIGAVTDDKDVPSALAVSWTSSLDGLLSQQFAKADGTATLSTTKLSSGIHTITLAVEDSDGLTGSDAITLTVVAEVPDGGTDRAISDGSSATDGSGVDKPGASDGGGGIDVTDSDAGAAGAITLNPLAKDTNGVDLTWSARPTTTFTSYRIYRGAASGSLAIINIVQDGAAAGYRDDSALIATSYSYRIGGVTAGGQEVLSNIQTIATGVSIAIGSQVEAMLVDPTRPYLYALDRVNNSLHFVNLTTNMKEKTIFVGSTPVDMDISQDGSKLYVANFGSSQIGVVDLTTKALGTPITVDTTLGIWDGNPYRLACLVGDTLVFTSMDQWCDLKLVNALTGAPLDNKASIYQPDLVAAPGGTTFYVGESGSTGSGLTRWDVVGNKMTQVDQSATVGGYGSRLVLISHDGMYVFYAGQKFLAKNLKSQVGSFSEPILAINSDGSLAIGMKSIHDGTTFAIKRPSPLSTPTMAISTDDSTVYLYDSMSSSIFIYRLK